MPRELTFRVDPSDTLFFRTGRPFQQDDEGLAEATTESIPNPRSFAMAARAAMARGAGWRDCDGPWEDGDSEMPGHGLDLGGYRFRGPFIKIDQAGDELVFPTPTILGERKSPTGPASEYFAAQPVMDSQLETDISDLKELDFVETDDSLDPPSAFIKYAGLKNLLRGYGINSDSFYHGDLTVPESRVGLARSATRHTAIDGQLYMATRQRIVESRYGRPSFIGSITPRRANNRRSRGSALLGGTREARPFSRSPIRRFLHSLPNYAILQKKNKGAGVI